jgi:hypothetical protein
VQPEVGFVDERGRLERMSPALAAHVNTGQAMQFVVHEWYELLQSGLVTVLPVTQERRDVVAGGHHVNPRSVK